MLRHSRSDSASCGFGFSHRILHISCQVQRHRWQRRCRGLLERVEAAFCSQSQMLLRGLVGAWRSAALFMGSQRASCLQQHRQARRTSRQVLAMLLRTRGQSLKKLCIFGWRTMMHLGE
ncbi:unnamed protein product, partial [Effrenium voratum]